MPPEIASICILYYSIRSIVHYTLLVILHDIILYSTVILITSIIINLIHGEPVFKKGGNIDEEAMRSEKAADGPPNHPL